jgi:hypothetical protein
MNIEYYTSILNPDCFFVAVENVLVAQWRNNCWILNGIYRPIRSHYEKVEWNKTPFDPQDINLKELQVVKIINREAIGSTIQVRGISKKGIQRVKDWGDSWEILDIGQRGLWIVSKKDVDGHSKRWLDLPTDSDLEIIK